jgi:hypothetical protein
VLEGLQSIKSIGQNPSLVNAIRGQAQAAQYSVSQRLATSDQVDQVDQLSQQVHDLTLQAKAEASCKQAPASVEQVDEQRRMFEASPLHNPDQRPASWAPRTGLASSSTTTMSGMGSGRPLLDDIFRNLFTVLSSDLADVFSRALVALIRHLYSLLHVWPQILLVWQIMRRLPPTISLILHDNITFEDVLGRIHSLQYQQFKHWRVFKHSLDVSFKGFPGSKRVHTGQFRLTNANMPDVVYDKSNWSQRIRPGSSLFMSVMIDGAPQGVQNCPRCEERVAKSEGRNFFCVACKLHWEVLKPTQKSDRESPNKSAIEVQRTQVRLSKHKVAELIHQMSKVTDETPDEWLRRQGVSADIGSSSQRTRPEHPTESTNMQHLQARWKRKQHICNELKSFKRVHVKGPVAPSVTVAGWRQEEPAVEDTVLTQRVKVIWVADGDDPRRMYPQVVES